MALDDEHLGGGLPLYKGCKRDRLNSSVEREREREIRLNSRVEALQPSS